VKNDVYGFPRRFLPGELRRGQLDGADQTTEQVAHGHTRAQPRAADRRRFRVGQGGTRELHGAVASDQVPDQGEQHRAVALGDERFRVPARTDAPQRTGIRGRKGMRTDGARPAAVSLTRCSLSLHARQGPRQRPGRIHIRETRAARVLRQHRVQRTERLGRDRQVGVQTGQQLLHDEGVGLLQEMAIRRKVSDRTATDRPTAGSH